MSNTLVSGASLMANQSLVSNNGIYILKVTSTGIVFLDNQQTGQRLWVKGRLGQAHPILTMESNGDLVFIEGNPAQVQWDSNTPQFPGAYAVLCDNGNLVIYDVHGDPVWATGTAQGPMAAAAVALLEMKASLEHALAKFPIVEKALLDLKLTPSAREVIERSAALDVNVRNHGATAE